jgi:hypothetical protein
MRVKSDSWRRRHALQIVAQLPENHDDAIAVLELAKELVNGFLAGEDEQPHPILAFSSASERR